MRELTELIVHYAVKAGAHARSLPEVLSSNVDLHWQMPPLCSGLTDGEYNPLEAYWNFAPVKSLDSYLAWYDSTLFALAAGKAAGYVPWRNHFTGCPLVKASQVRILYSAPNNWPNHGNPEACFFAIEAVDHLRVCLPNVHVEESDSTYLLHDSVLGPIVGVKDGCAFSRSFGNSGGLEAPVQVLRSMFRGKLVPDKQETVLHQLRLWVIEKAGLVPTFDVLDTLLQGFYFGRHGSHGSLKIALNLQIAKELRKAETRSTFKEVLDGWDALGTTNRSRVSAAFMKLSPSPITRDVFFKRIFDLNNRLPLELSEATTEAIRGKLYLEFEKFCKDNGLKP